MTDQVEINKAIGAHGLWKQRLKEAIATRRSTFSVEHVHDSSICDFGKWLKTLPAEVRATARWKNIQEYHARFHASAAQILALALQGANSEAEAALSFGSEFTNISATLISGLMEWKTEIRAGGEQGAGVSGDQAGTKRGNQHGGFGVTTKLMTLVLSGVFVPLLAVAIYPWIMGDAMGTPVVFVIIAMVVSGAVFAPVAYAMGNGIAGPIHGLTKNMRFITEGNLGKSELIKASGEVGKLVTTFDIMSEILTSLVFETQSVARKLRTSSDALVNASEEVSSSSENVASTQQQITKGAQNQASMVIGAQKMIQSLSEGVNDVKKNADSIAQVVDLISNIAGQTNLLALNAAIEAARAGESGRGFSVVADQVRKLADESRQAVKRTENMVAAIMDTSEAQTRAASEVVGAIDSIATVAEETSASTEEASAAAEEQAASMEQISATAQALAELAETLRRIIGTFRFGEENRDAHPPHPSPLASEREEASERMKVTSLPVESPKPIEQKKDSF